MIPNTKIREMAGTKRHDPQHQDQRNGRNKDMINNTKIREMVGTNRHDAQHQDQRNGRNKQT